MGIPRTGAGLAIALATALAGCATDSFLDPSKTGRFESEPTMIPILDRIDVIEDRDERWARTTEPTPEDLLPNDLTYRLTPGDFVTVEIFELFITSRWEVRTTRVDAGGYIRLPVVGDVLAAGRTAQELEDQIEEMLRSDLVVIDPEVHVLVEEGSAFTWIIRGAIQAPGQYTLRDPDLRLLQAIAQAGDVSARADLRIAQPNRIFVIRQVPLSEAIEPSFERDRPGAETDQPGARPTDVEELIEQLDRPDDDAGDAGSGGDSGGGSGGGAGDGGAPLVDVEDVNAAPDPSVASVSPGALQDPQPPPIDIDDLEPVQVPTPTEQQPPVDIGRTDTPRSGDISYIYDEERGQWIPVRRPAGAEDDLTAAADDRPLAVERIIEIPYQELTEGQTKFNIIIRPNDYIYVEPPLVGLVYIEGEVGRPGTFQLPVDGSELTLSRAIAAAGGLGPLAIPTRVDLTRVVGPNREATIRLDLAAIRQRTEPDVILRPMDHIIVGTDFWATPLAVIRNGFRVTYGFGFLLDRNFGNDVFGAPPVNISGN